MLKKMIWKSVEMAKSTEKYTAAIRWMEILLYLIFLFYMGISLYFFYIGLAAISQFPYSGTFSQLYPLAFQISRISSLVTLSFAVIMLITGVLGKIAVRTTNHVLLVTAIIMQLMVGSFLIGTAIYSNEMVTEAKRNSDLKFTTTDDEKKFEAFMSNIIITCGVLGSAIIVGMGLTSGLCTLLKLREHGYRKQFKLVDTMGLVGASSYEL